MVSMKDHEDEKGNLNWETYRAAQKQEGEVCMTCGAYLVIGKGHPQNCLQCSDAEKPDELRHDKFLRCPLCGETWNPSDAEDYEVYEDGEHDVTCQHCDFEFRVQTHVSWTFTSPARVPEGTWRCDRCKKLYNEAKGDGYCGLCPKCADETEEED